MTVEHYYSFYEALRQLKVSEDELKNYVSSGDLRVKKRDGQFIFLMEDVDRLAEKLMSES